ncbi:beta-lactamase family protein [Allorhizobium sp. BGMRC 0089]|uniref:serine hydrolase domain-containing protein n=1 Tax=Allorhizobium sonneratiae TaxID=2934936 RepID=UPI0020345374|nr:serine hydrolase [Allorhizobium sonneratiae]MCM2294196.1 beta-lactamase family protein [Allorhizobium sonneratiae]
MGQMILYVRRLFFPIAVVLAGFACWLVIAPPQLLRVGTGYAAKMVCSNVFIAGRDPDIVVSRDVQAPGNPLLRLLRVTVDRQEKQVTAYMFGAFAPGIAIYRPGLGCASVPDGRMSRAREVKLAGQPEPVAAKPDMAWPDGDAPVTTAAALKPVLEDKALTGPGMRAVLVVKDGALVGESYGQGFGPERPLIGWSMTKTVTAMLVGARIGEGKLSLDQDHLFTNWNKDGRAAIKLGDLMAMQSGLAFNEDYGDVSDVTRMLFLKADEAGFVARMPLEVSPGSRFRYSTGTAVLVARVLMNSFASREEALAYPQTALFGPLGLRHAVFEADEAGTLAGGSYLYATARDWARLAQLQVQDGIWQGKRLLPEGYVENTLWRPTASSKGSYTHGMMWRSGPGGEKGKAYSLPDDTVWFEGHDGQSIAIVPSHKLIVLRMGLTPSSRGYLPQPLLKAVLAAGY